jgi:putative acetyltransferase
MKIRPDTACDWTAIEALHRQSFGGSYEADLNARLRADGLAAVSLVADDHGEIVGHILFSWIGAEVEGRPVQSLALAPMAVRPDRQRQGIGSQLVLSGIEAARSSGAEAIIVLGHLTFYPRFGFSAALAAHLASPFKGQAFMALEIVPDSLAGARGSVTHPSAFGLPS